MIITVTRIATSDDHDAVSTLRREAYSKTYGFAMRAASSVDWNDDDEAGAVIVVCDRNDRLISSMRLTALTDQVVAEAFLHYSLKNAHQEYPTAAMSRASTLPEYGSHGLQGLIRHAYLTALPGSGLRSVCAIVFDSAPRVNSLRSIGFELTHCSQYWDTEADIHGEALVATLGMSKFEFAKNLNFKACTDIIEHCQFEFDGIRDIVHKLARDAQV
jgi:hypothetical protein